MTSKQGLLRRLFRQNSRKPAISGGEFDEQLDMRGYQCPTPVLNTRHRLKALQPGQVLFVMATDPGSELDIKELVNKTGDELIEFQQAEGEFHYWIRKSA